MEVNINHLNEFERELQITVPWESVKGEYDELLKQYSKIPVKGFRAGKTPLSAVESIFKNEIKTDLARGCSTRFCRKALKENNMEAGTPIEITEIHLLKNQQFILKTQFTEMPSFDLPDYYCLNFQSGEEEEQLTEISERLLEQTILNVPSALVENELKYTEAEEGLITESERKAAEERVKLMLILKKIATLDNIEIDERDIEERINMIAVENEVTAKELKEFLWSNGGMSRLSDSLLAEQVLKYIISRQVN